MNSEESITVLFQSEEVQRMLTKLLQSHDPQLCQVEVLKMQGYGNADIAKCLDVRLRP